MQIILKHRYNNGRMEIFTNHRRVPEITFKTLSELRQDKIIHLHINCCGHGKHWKLNNLNARICKNNDTLLTSKAAKFAKTLTERFCCFADRGSDRIAEF